jgi:hypothetical protein
MSTNDHHSIVKLPSLTSIRKHKKGKHINRNYAAAKKDVKSSNTETAIVTSKNRKYDQEQELISSPSSDTSSPTLSPSSTELSLDSGHKFPSSSSRIKNFASLDMYNPIETTILIVGEFSI